MYSDLLRIWQKSGLIGYLSSLLKSVVVLNNFAFVYAIRALVVGIVNTLRWE